MRELCCVIDPGVRLPDDWCVWRVVNWGYFTAYQSVGRRNVSYTLRSLELLPWRKMPEWPPATLTSYHHANRLWKLGHSHEPWGSRCPCDLIIECIESGAISMPIVARPPAERSTKHAARFRRRISRHVGGSRICRLQGGAVEGRTSKRANMASIVATISWGGKSGNWNTGTLWTGSMLPGTADVAEIDTSAGTDTIPLNDSQSVGGGR